MAESLGEFVKRHRVAAGLSKREVATRAGFSHTSVVGHIENGSRLNPSVRTLYGLANALGVARQDILAVAGGITEGMTLAERAYPALGAEGHKALEGIAAMLAKYPLKDYKPVLRQCEMALLWYHDREAE